MLVTRSSARLAARSRVSFASPKRKSPTKKKNVSLRRLVTATTDTLKHGNPCNQVRATAADKRKYPDLKDLLEHYGAEFDKVVQFKKNLPKQLPVFAAKASIQEKFKAICDLAGVDPDTFLPKNCIHKGKKVRNEIRMRTSFGLTLDIFRFAYAYAVFTRGPMWTCVHTARLIASTLCAMVLPTPIAGSWPTCLVWTQIIL